MPGSILYQLAGSSYTLPIASVILLIVASIYIVSVFGLVKKMKFAPLLVIAVSVVNRSLALVLYFISPAFAFWAVWTIILVAVSYIDFRRIRQTKT